MNIHVLHHARIHTLDGENPHASALAIAGGTILAVGSSEALLIEFPLNGTPSQPVTHEHMQGKTILPGLTDAHIHLEQYALSLQKVDCETATLRECLERVAGRAARLRPGEWVLGHGWNQTRWLEGFGSAADLDAAAPHNPVYLTAKSLHAGWANTAALRQAGIEAGTSDPDNGRIGRDEFGKPNGIVYEGAMRLLDDAIPPPDEAGVAAALEEVQAALWKQGVTGVHDFDRRRCFAALQQLHGAGRLRLRVLKSIPLESLGEAAALGLRSGFGDDLLRIGGVKAFADGALGPRTAAMLQPYAGEPENRGMLLIDGEHLFEIGRQAAEAGLSMAVHAIGDRANHELLNALEQLRAYEAQRGLPHLRHRIEHVQVIHPEDAPRLARLGVAASMQPIHATSDMQMADRYWGERVRTAYAWNTQVAYGARLAFGSDAPVEAPNPFWGLHAAVTRRRQDGSPGADGWTPPERIGLDTALRAYTAGPAYLAGMEKSLGSLIPGKLADLIVLDEDPYSIEAQRLWSLTPAATMVAGEWVYRA
jgi:hypothetical protein